jgi:hypothetical protein
MKDVVIPARTFQREALVLLLCVALALLVNACAIIAYKTQWSELLTAWRYTLALALVLYGALILPRLCWAGLRRLLKPVR